MKCIHLNMECSAICEVAVKVMTMDGKIPDALCKSCIKICKLCAEECSKYSYLEHCHICAMVCRECVEICEHMIFVDTVAV